MNILLNLGFLVAYLDLPRKIKRTGILDPIEKDRGFGFKNP
jgi:hypothetical protein